MKQDLFIKLLEQGQSVSLYSFQFVGEQYSEFEKFLLAYKDREEFADDLGVILARLNVIKENGAQDRYLRYESTKNDRVFALPAYIDSSQLRVYCLRVSDGVLILGNGGEKTTRTYNEDEYLNGCVQTLRKIDIELKIRENKKLITISGTNIEGELSFYIKD
ncbi:MAG: hypothetical protein MJZ55_01360 [Paludibacteraceae bacterium]|nr:hypothetical protein [Paludibacteraceae bacterium]